MLDTASILTGRPGVWRLGVGCSSPPLTTDRRAGMIAPGAHALRRFGRRVHQAVKGDAAQCTAIGFDGDFFNLGNDDSAGKGGGQTQMLAPPFHAWR